MMTMNGVYTLMTTSIRLPPSVLISLPRANTLRHPEETERRLRLLLAGAHSATLKMRYV